MKTLLRELPATAKDQPLSLILWRTNIIGSDEHFVNPVFTGGRGGSERLRIHPEARDRRITKDESAAGSRKRLSPSAFERLSRGLVFGALVEDLKEAFSSNDGRDFKDRLTAS